jgi:4-amino-4-deoxy-L-arabinose transferase-like glycosyltransferase
MKTPAPKAPHTVASLLILTAVTLACLLPFIGKAFHIDDPLFIWCARHIQSDPFNFYGFSLNWYGRETSMAAVTQNPPLAAYYLALVGSLLGWSEFALHIGFLLPALAVVLGTYCLGRNFCSQPFWAALATVAAPVFLLSSTSVMCDTMMMAFWMWSVFFWMEGIKTGNPAILCVAALLVAACSLTKYFGISLIPLLLTYSWLDRRRIGSWLAYLCLPVLALAFYQWLTHRLYGRGLLLNAVAYATHLRVGGELPSKLLAGLAFAGGGMVMLLTAAPLLWDRKKLVAGIFMAIMVGLFVLTMKEVGGFPMINAGKVNWLFVIQISLWVTTGTSLILLVALDWLRQKTPASALLDLWVAGTFVFACAVNWTISGRNILPMLPAVSLLLIRRLEARDFFREWRSTRLLLGPLGVSLLITLLVARADYRWADSARTAASFMTRKLGVTPNAIWFEGHWGFQYYMEKLGAKALDRHDLHLSPNEVMVVPMNNSYLFPLPEDQVEPWSEHEFPASKWLATMSAGAGYYSDAWGPLPFVFCSAPAEQYLVFRVK